MSSCCCSRLAGYLGLLRATFTTGSASQLCRAPLVDWGAACAHRVTGKRDLWGQARVSLSGSCEAIFQRPPGGRRSTHYRGCGPTAPVGPPIPRLGRTGCGPGRLCLACAAEGNGVGQRGLVHSEPTLAWCSLLSGGPWRNPSCCPGSQREASMGVAATSVGSWGRISRG